MAELEKKLKSAIDTFQVCNDAMDEADGTAQCSTPYEKYKDLNVGKLNVDTTSLANDLFAPTGPRIPAEQLGMASAYDFSQAQSRLASMYNMTRADYYKQSNADLEAKKSRNSLKQKMAVGFINASSDVIKAFTIQKA